MSEYGGNTVNAFIENVNATLGTDPHTFTFSLVKLHEH